MMFAFSRLFWPLQISGLLLFTLLTLPSVAFADPLPDRIVFGLGEFDVLDDEDALDLRLEYRWGDDLFAGIRPFIGGEVNTKGNVYALGGVFYDWYLTDQFIMTPLFGVGVHAENAGVDLGHNIQFRSQLEFAYQLPNDYRLGVAFSHMSNGGLGDANPGAEILNLYFSVPYN